jgi:hypothetical protein
VGTGLPDASREGVARTASKEVAALPTNDATARPVSRRSSTYVFMSFDMEPCFMVSSDIAPFFMSFLLHVLPASCLLGHAAGRQLRGSRLHSGSVYSPARAGLVHIVALRRRAGAVLRKGCAVSMAAIGIFFVNRSAPFDHAGTASVRNAGSHDKLLKLLTNSSCCAEANGGAIGAVGAWNRSGSVSDGPVA